MKARMPEGYQNGAGGAQNVGQMIKQAQKMQDQIRTLQDELDTREYTTTVGGGMVELTMSGARELKVLKINPDIVDKDNVDDLEDLVMAGVNTVLTKVEEESATEMEKITGGISFPGLI
ncbi:nucleoid-associated protein, YbaB/EbfC family [Clostridia bacterium]|nr:nucleoid-associated protein, YbaB/EbfC family [Clostridia bacterium]